MEKSIEHIWKNGFTNQTEFKTPKVFDFYNQKSKLLADNVLDSFKRQVNFLPVIAACIFIFNIILDNNHAVFWGIISALPTFYYYYIGKKQYKALSAINYGESCYDYLLSLKSKIDQITQFNKRLSIFIVPIFLFPMLVFTYFNQYGKTFGEIFGVDQFNYPTSTIFLLLPIITLLNYALVELVFKRYKAKRFGGLDKLIADMEALSD